MVCAQAPMFSPYKTLDKIIVHQDVAPQNLKKLAYSWALLVVLLAALIIPAQCATTLFVDKTGTRPGSFRTVQGAIDAVPSPNKDWVIIQIGKGVFWEKVRIPNEKSCLILKGSGRQLTEIAFDDHNNGTDESSTFMTGYSQNLVIKHLSIRNNAYKHVPSKQAQAPAAYIKADRSYMYDVGFYGYQDTLWDHTGRHYFNNCMIEGAIDFIFGNGQSIFENSHISIIGSGYITAHSRGNPKENTGFVFKNCVIHGTESTLLGRPWRPYARTIFSHCYLPAAINASGWDSWKSKGHENQLLYAEDNCYGPGANTSGRVSWESHLTREEVQAFTDLNYINAYDWLLTPPFQEY